MRGGVVTSPSSKVSLSSAAAEFGQEERHAEEDPHHQQAGAERQQGERVQEAGVQAQVAHRQQAAQVLLDHGLPGTDAAEGTGRRRCGGGRGAAAHKDGDDQGEGGRRAPWGQSKQTDGVQQMRVEGWDGKQNPRGRHHNNDVDFMNKEKQTNKQTAEMIQRNRRIMLQETEEGKERKKIN